MIRAFVALPLDQSVQARLNEIAERLRTLGLSARFARADSIHLTLKFLGSVEEEKLEQIRRGVEESLRDVLPIELSVQGLGAFPSLARPRVVWIGVAHNDRLSRLKNNLERCLNPLGFEPDEREFKPHLTLVRLKSQKNVGELIRFLLQHGQDQRAGHFTAKRLQLMQSFLKPEGAEYRELFSLPLE